MTPRRLGLIGCGAIGAPVLEAVQAGSLPGWTLCSVLVRRPRHDADVRLTADLDAFLSTGPDLVVEMAGPRALAAVGEAVLQRSDLWTISPAALADETLLQRMRLAGGCAGHRLRVLAGAMAGLDGVAALAAAPGATLSLRIGRRSDRTPASTGFAGSVRQAATRFPDDVNVAVAAALAGPGLDQSRIEVVDRAPGDGHRLAFHAESAAGDLHVEVLPRLDQGVHPVSCSVIAALRRESLTVWVG